MNSVITEAHLYEREVSFLALPAYDVISKDCRKDVALGGAAIVAQLGVAIKELRGARRPPQTSNACSAMLLSSSLEDSALRLTGARSPPPPTARATPALVSSITDRDNQSLFPSGDIMGHVVVTVTLCFKNWWGVGNARALRPDPSYPRTGVSLGPHSVPAGW